MADAKKFAEELGITKEGSYVDGVYTIVLDNSNEYSKVYTLLDKSDKVDLDGDEVNLGVDSSIMVYLADDFDISLIANFEEDSYVVKFEEVN